MRKKFGTFFMTVGIVLITAAAVILIYNQFENKKARSDSAVLVNSLMQIIDENRLTEKEEDPFDTEMKTVEIDGYSYIGYLAVPDLNIDLPVMAEWDYHRLKISPCRYYGSTKTDNLVIAAHNYRSHFGYLGNLKPGATVIFTDVDGNITTYTVTVTEFLQPTDVDKVKDTGDDLILYTCTYGGAERITVRCSIKI